MLRTVLVSLIFLFAVVDVCGQAVGKKRVNVKFFGHVGYTADADTGEWANTFSLGEQSIFITANITDRISFLGETTIKWVGSKNTFSPGIERVQIKYDYFGKHSVLIGKMHTPVNYWNDVYHHGRLFFPTIDRPKSFKYLVPVHTLGLRLQGQNMGKIGFGYDLMIGNGISSKVSFRRIPTSFSLPEFILKQLI